jgi:hypothetical protein
VLLLSAPLPEHSKTVAMMVETSSNQVVQRGIADDAARLGVNPWHHQRGSDQPSSSIQFNIAFDDGQQILAGDGPSVLEHVCNMGLEGIVSKRTDAPYRCGPSKI